MVISLLFFPRVPPENPCQWNHCNWKYVSGYACKGNQSTGAVVDLFKDMVNCADESTGATTKSL